MPARLWGPCLLAAGLLTGCTVVVRPGTPSQAPPPVEAPLLVEAPPPVAVAPTVVVIQGTAVGYVSNWPEDLFYYGRRWYRPYRGLWYRATALGGPWVRITVSSVPRPVREVPRDYRWRPRPGAPQQTVIVQPAPPPQQTVIVQPAPPPQQTVIVQAPPPAPQTVVVQAPPPPPQTVVVQAPPPPPQTVVESPVPPARPAPTPAPPAALPPPASPPGHQAKVNADAGGGRPSGPPEHAPAQGRHGKTIGPLTVTPVMVPIPGSPVTFAENWEGDLFQYEGRWYRTHAGEWYRAASASGEWTVVAREEVPAPVRDLPPDYRKQAKEHRGRGPAPEPPGQGERPGKKKS